MESEDPALFNDGELADHPPVMIKRAFDAYNTAARAAGWPETANLTEGRKKALKVALKDCGGLAGWEMALARAAKSDFLCGKVKTLRAPTGFRDMKLAFMLRPVRLTSLLDGEYDNREAAPAPAGPTFRQRLNNAARPVKEQVPFVLDTTREQRMAETILLYRKHKRWADANRVEDELARIEGRPPVLVPAPDARNPDVVPPRMSEQKVTSPIMDAPPDWWEEIPEGDEAQAE